MVKLIFKKSDRKKNISKYSPVANLHIISKIIENLIYARFSSFLLKYKVIDQNRLGFKSEKST